MATTKIVEYISREETLAGRRARTSLLMSIAQGRHLQVVSGMTHLPAVIANIEEVS